MPAPPFTVAVGPRTGAEPTQPLTAFDTVSMRLNWKEGATLSFTTTGDSAEAEHIEELVTDVWLRGQLTQRFRVISVDGEWNESGDCLLSVQSASYKRLFNRRLVGPNDLSYAGVDQGQLVWNLIAHTQAKPGGNMGITQGPSVTGQPRDRVFVDGDNIGKEVMALQDVINGLWWDIDAELVYSAGMPAALLPVKPTPVVWGATARRMRRRSSADQFFNALRGEGDPEVTTRVWQDSPTILTDPQGRWERAESWSTTQLQASLIDNVEGALEQANRPLTVWNVELEPERWMTDAHYLPGDYVVLVVPEGAPARIYPQPRVVAQLGELGADIDKDGGVTIQAAFIETDLEPPA